MQDRYKDFGVNICPFENSEDQRLNQLLNGCHGSAYYEPGSVL